MDISDDDFDGLLEQPLVHARSRIAELEARARDARTMVGALDNAAASTSSRISWQETADGSRCRAARQRATTELANIQHVLDHYRSFLRAIEAAQAETALHWRDRRLAELEREWSFCDAVWNARLPSSVTTPEPLELTPPVAADALPWACGGGKSAAEDRGADETDRPGSRRRLH